MKKEFKKVTIVVGTMSDQKIGYLRDVLGELKIQAKLIPIEADSGVSQQPKTSEETERGSINRAKSAFEKVKEADFSIGIEVGYHKNENEQYEMFCWVTIVDDDEYQISSQSHRFMLPKYFQDLLKNDIYLGDNLDGYLQKDDTKNHFKKHVDDIVRNRKPFIENALKNALIRYLNKEDF